MDPRSHDLRLQTRDFTCDLSEPKIEGQHSLGLPVAREIAKGASSRDLRIVNFVPIPDGFCES